jgi:hypothetical protein
VARRSPPTAVMGVAETPFDRPTGSRTAPTDSLQCAEGPSLCSGLAAGHRLDPVDRAVERENLADSSRLGVRNKVRLGKIRPVELEISRVRRSAGVSRHRRQMSRHIRLSSGLSTLAHASGGGAAVSSISTRRTLASRPLPAYLGHRGEAGPDPGAPRMPPRPLCGTWFRRNHGLACRDRRGAWWGQSVVPRSVIVLEREVGAANGSGQL